LQSESRGNITGTKWLGAVGYSGGITARRAWSRGSKVVFKWLWIAFDQHHYHWHYYIFLPSSIFHCHSLAGVTLGRRCSKESQKKTKNKVKKRNHEFRF
jgi:hypothetical protein